MDWTQQPVISLAGEVDLDLTKRPPAAGARLTIIHLLGSTEVRVPNGRRFSVGGLTVFGHREIDVTPATGPDLPITIINLLGGIRMTEPGVAGVASD
jgi:hypothetical protein